MALLNNKLELQSYLIDLINEHVDITDFLDDAGVQRYLPNAFQEILFKETDEGSVSIDPDSPILGSSEPKRYIPTYFANASLEKEEIRQLNTLYTKTGDVLIGNDVISNMDNVTNLEVGYEVSGAGITAGSVIAEIVNSNAVRINNPIGASGTGSTFTFNDKPGYKPLESWLGVVTMSFFVPINISNNSTDKEQFNDIYARLEDFQETYLRNTLKTISFSGETRAISIRTKRIIEEENTTRINRVQYKIISVVMNININNPQFLQGDRVTFEAKLSTRADYELLNTLGKGYTSSIDLIDRSESGVALTKWNPDIATNGMSFGVVFDYESQFVQDVYDVMKSNGIDNKIENAKFDINMNFEILNPVNEDSPVILSVPRTMYLENIEPNIPSDSGVVVLVLSFREAK